MEELEFYTQEELLDRVYGELGTPARDEYEAGLKSFLEKERIRHLRQEKRSSSTPKGKRKAESVNA